MLSSIVLALLLGLVLGLSRGRTLPPTEVVGRAAASWEAFTALWGRREVLRRMGLLRNGVTL